MSHKNWFSVFNPMIQKWAPLGIPIDDEIDRDKHQLAIGPFRSKRGAEYSSKLNGALINSSIQETEDAAKKAEEAILPPLPAGEMMKVPFSTVVEVPITPPILTPIEPYKLNLGNIPEAEFSSYTNAMLRNLMD